MNIGVIVSNRNYRKFFDVYGQLRKQGHNLIFSVDGKFPSKTIVEKVYRETKGDEYIGNAVDKIVVAKTETTEVGNKDEDVKDIEIERSRKISPHAMIKIKENNIKIDDIPGDGNISVGTLRDAGLIE